MANEGDGKSGLCGLYGCYRGVSWSGAQTWRQWRRCRFVDRGGVGFAGVLGNFVVWQERLEFLRPGFFTDGAVIVNGWFFVCGAIGLYAEGHRFFLYGRIFVFGLSRCRRLCLFAETICPDEGTQQQPCAFSVWKSGFAVGDADRRQLASELFTIIKIEEGNYEKIDNVKEFVERIDSSKKLNPKDLSSDQDLTIAIMNLISIEEHLVFREPKPIKTLFMIWLKRSESCARPWCKNYSFVWRGSLVYFQTFAGFFNAIDGSRYQTTKLA